MAFILGVCQLQDMLWRQKKRKRKENGQKERSDREGERERERQSEKLLVEQPEREVVKM